MKLTAWENHPNKVHEKVISPKVKYLRSRVCNFHVVVVEHARGIVKDQSVYLSNADDDLERVAERMRGRDESRNNEAHRAPGELFSQMLVSWSNYAGT